MSARNKMALVVVVMLALVCIGFMAVVGMSAAASADEGSDHGYDGTEHERPDDDERPDERDGDERPDRNADDGSEDRRTRVNVHVTGAGATVSVGGDSAVDVTVEAVDGSYAAEGQYRLEPGDTLELPAPEEPTTLRAVAESDDARLEAMVAFEAYEFDCGETTHRQVAPAEVSYEWEGASRERSRTQTFERPPVECPELPGDDPGTPPGDDPGTPPGDDPSAPSGDDPEDTYNDSRDGARDAYNDSQEEFWDTYEEGNETTWRRYEMARALGWDGYEDGRAAFWDTYERLRDGGGDEDPQDRVNETRDEAEREANETRSFAERVGEDARDGAEQVREDAESGANRVANDTSDGVDRVENDTSDDVDRVRKDAEEDRQRIENEANRTIDEVTPDDGGDENESDDGDPLPGGDLVSADADADAGRDGDTVRASGSAEVDVANGTAHARVYERLAVDPGEEP